MHQGTIICTEVEHKSRLVDGVGVTFLADKEVVDTLSVRVRKSRFRVPANLPGVMRSRYNSQGDPSLQYNDDINQWKRLRPKQKETDPISCFGAR